MLTLLDALPMLVLIVKFALLLPAGTVTLEGTLAAPLLLESATCAPPAGAGPLNVTVPVEDCAPPILLVGCGGSEGGADAGGEAGSTVSETAGVRSLRATEMATEVEAASMLALT